MVVTIRSKRVDLCSSTGKLKIGVERGWLKKSGIDASYKYLTMNEVTEGISYFHEYKPLKSKCMCSWPEVGVHYC